MAPADLPTLLAAIRERHSCEATFLEGVQVLLTLQHGTVWSGEVQVFDVSGHPLALRCYAWSEAIAGGERKVYTVLAFPPVSSAADAVRAALAGGRGDDRDGGPPERGDA